MTAALLGLMAGALAPLLIAALLILLLRRS